MVLKTQCASKVVYYHSFFKGLGHSHVLAVLLLVSSFQITSAELCFLFWCAGQPNQNMYLGIFESEMTHVVVDQAKGKAPVHDGQASLRRETGVSAHAVEVCETDVIQDKTTHLSLETSALKTDLLCSGAEPQ